MKRVFLLQQFYFDLLDLLLFCQFSLLYTTSPVSRKKRTDFCRSNSHRIEKVKQPKCSAQKRYEFHAFGKFNPKHSLQIIFTLFEYETTIYSNSFYLHNGTVPFFASLISFISIRWRILKRNQAHFLFIQSTYIIIVYFSNVK